MRSAVIRNSSTVDTMAPIPNALSNTVNQIKIYLFTFFSVYELQLVFADSQSKCNRQPIKHTP